MSSQLLELVAQFKVGSRGQVSKLQGQQAD